jgi:small GTP-binding protein
MNTEARKYKVVIIGDPFVGKTSIIRCFNEQSINPFYTPTLGASFISKDVAVQDTTVNLNIWDTAGQERYRSLVPTYVRGAEAAILCYDVTSVSSFNSLDGWFNFIQNFLSSGYLLYVVGNKIDLEPVVPRESAIQWAKEHHDAPCFFTSAEHGTAIPDLLKAIATALSLGNSRKMLVEPEPGELKLVEQEPVGSKCCE